MENKYRTLVDLIEKNNFRIVKKNCYDPQSGWEGEDLIITDGDNYIYNLSGNGYCFYDSSVDEAIEVINRYLEKKNMTTFEAFSAWVHSVAVNR